MKLKALCTIIGAGDARAPAGSEFDTEEFSIDAAEAAALIARGFAAEVAQETAPAADDVPAEGAAPAAKPKTGKKTAPEKAADEKEAEGEGASG